MSEGWRCPLCGRVYAPSVLQCGNCIKAVPGVVVVPDVYPPPGTPINPSQQPYSTGEPPPFQQTWI